MDQKQRDKSSSKSVSLYTSEWDFVERMIAEHRYPDRSSFIRALLTQAFPEEFQSEHLLPSTVDEVEVKNRVDKLEQRILFFEKLINELKTHPGDLSRAIQVAEDQSNYQPKKP